MEKNYIATILSFLAVVLTLGVLLFLFYPDENDESVSGGGEGGVSAESLTQFSKKLEEQQAAQTQQQQQAFDKLATALKDDQKAALDKLLSEVEQIARRLGALERDIAARPLPGALVKSNDLETLRQELEERLTALSQRVRAPRGSAFALLGLSLGQLKQRAATGAAFSDEHTTLARLMPPSKSLERLSLYSGGVRSRPMLAIDFSRAMEEARARASAPSSSPLLALVYRFVKIRPLSEKEGTGTSALLSQLTARMEEGDLVAALALREKLAASFQDPTAYQSLLAWFVEANRRYELDTALVQLESEIYRLLADSVQKKISTPVAPAPAPAAAPARAVPKGRR